MQRNRRRLTTRSGRVAQAILCAAVFAACSSPDKGFTTRKVTRDDFGDQWPFRGEAGVLECVEGGGATFTQEGLTVGLDDPDFGEFNGRVWAPSATVEQAAAIREAASEMCD